MEESAATERPWKLLGSEEKKSKEQTCAIVPSLENEVEGITLRNVGGDGGRRWKPWPAIAPRGKC